MMGYKFLKDVISLSGNTRQQPKQKPMLKNKWSILNLETINILQQEEGIYPSIKIFKLDGSEIEYEKLTVFIETNDIFTALVEDNQMNTQKYIVSKIKIGSIK